MSKKRNSRSKKPRKWQPPLVQVGRTVQQIIDDGFLQERLHESNRSGGPLQFYMGTDYDAAIAALAQAMTGDELPPRPPGDEEIIDAVCGATRLAPEHWDRLAPMERVPWIKRTIRELTVRDGGKPKPKRKPKQQPPKGKPGRRGYPLEALEYARKIRRENPSMKAQAIRGKCLEKFSEDDLPNDADSFRRWLNRKPSDKRANRAN